MHEITDTSVQDDRNDPFLAEKKIWSCIVWRDQWLRQQVFVTPLDADQQTTMMKEAAYCKIEERVGYRLRNPTSSAHLKRQEAS